MTIINNFNSLKRHAVMPATDILIWAASLTQYKIFGYTTKLYCTPNDIDFLKQWHLYELYDIIDTDFLVNNAQLNKVNDAHFWSTRKIEELHHEYCDLHNSNVVYSDTDVVMFMPFNFQSNVVLWTEELWEQKFLPDGTIDWRFTIYPTWDCLSTPPQYVMPDYIRDNIGAYNCGIMYFKDAALFQEYYEQYYKFVIDNPAQPLKGKFTEANNNIFPCNAEQRILKAVLDYHNIKPQLIMPERKSGICDDGAHFFMYRLVWPYLNGERPVDLSDEMKQVWDESILVLNVTVASCLANLAYYSPQLCNFWISQPWLLHFSEQYQKGNQAFLQKYY